MRVVGVFFSLLTVSNNSYNCTISMISIEVYFISLVIYTPFFYHVNIYLVCFFEY